MFGLTITECAGPVHRLGSTPRKTARQYTGGITQVNTSCRNFYRQQFPRFTTPALGGHNNVDVSTDALQSATIAPDKVLEEEQNGELSMGGAQFDWVKQWYPLAVADDLDPTRPHAQHLLGKEMVLWRDDSKTWRCFEDKCAHRSAPLSEGRIDPADQTIMCSYHGWKYGSSGQAVSIPQARFDGEANEATAKLSKRSCVKSFPTQEHHGLVWVWPVWGPEAFIESAATSIVSCPDLEGEDPLNPENSLLLIDRYVHDMPASLDTVIENVSDQSHVPWAHHGVAGDRTSKYANHFDIPASTVGAGTKDGHGVRFELTWSPTPGKEPTMQIVTYAPPSYIGFYTPRGDDSWSAFWINAVPMTPDTTRVFNHSIAKVPTSAMIRTLSRALLPRWAPHLFLNEIFDGDIIYLYKQSRTNRVAFKGKNSNEWAKAYYLPGQSDRGVVAFRRWYHGRGGGGPPFFNPDKDVLPPINPPRTQLLDRYDQHTKHCTSCKKALMRVQRLQIVLKVVAAACGAAALRQVNSGSSALSAIPMALSLAAVAALALSQVLYSFLERRFVFTDYVHSDK